MGASRKVKSAGVDLNTAEKADEIPGGKQAGNRRKTSEVRSGEVRCQCELFCTHTHVCLCLYSVLRWVANIAKLTVKCERASLYGYLY